MATGEAVESFLAMLAAERGAAANTLAAYRRDLEGVAELIGDPVAASRDALAKLSAAWSDLAPSTVARKSSALRQFYGFCVDEGLRDDDPSSALPRPATASEAGHVCRTPSPQAADSCQAERAVAGRARCRRRRRHTEGT